MQKRGWSVRSVLVAALIGAVIMAGCSKQDGSGGSVPRAESLYRGGLQWGAPPGFNPIGVTSAWPTNNDNLLYESLFAYNLVTGNLDPLLAASHKWETPQVLSITLQNGTKWQDGKALTPEDVVYTLQIGKELSVSYSPIWDFVSKVETNGDRGIKITLNPEKPHRAMVETYLTNIRIIPKHIYSKWQADGKNIIQEENMSPVGSGPYKLKSQSPEQIILQRDDSYWGKSVYGLPAPKYQVHPIYKSNDAANLALQQGEIDLSQNFVPQVWQMWEKEKQPVGTWFKEEPYHIPASIPSLYVNVHKNALNNPQVRRALAYAINYPKIAELAMSKYSPTAQSSLIIPVGVPEQKYFDANDAKQHGWEYNPKKAVEILENELGAKKGADGIYVLPDGSRLGPWTVQCPYGWTDWMTALELVAQSAKEIGIDIKTDFPEAPVWTNRLQTGDFDFILNTPAGGYSPAHPWVRFRDVLDDRGVPKMGEVAFWNYGRYSNPAVAPLLDKAANAETEAELAAIYKDLNRIYMQDIPIIPLMYRPWEFYTFNETYWTNFPTAANKAGTPQHNNAGVKNYYVIKPVKK